MKLKNFPQKSADFKAKTSANPTGMKHGADISHYFQQRILNNVGSKRSKGSYSLPEGDQKANTTVINHSGIKRDRVLDKPTYGEQD